MAGCGRNYHTLEDALTKPERGKYLNQKVIINDASENMLESANEIY